MIDNQTKEDYLWKSNRLSEEDDKVENERMQPNKTQILKRNLDASDTILYPVIQRVSVNLSRRKKFVEKKNKIKQMKDGIEIWKINERICYFPKQHQRLLFKTPTTGAEPPRNEFWSETRRTALNKTKENSNNQLGVF
ncbi:hypothetical protein RFI_38807 [Reticulomyxa filosa]|uniref:Uncharacterized protein n=1 Tax=Reticulomyxa filosa TaxID=46433 RepID=X6LBC6_RETFI|nr:hypothetical protein RFI_38807 [Reticulomyxa filosa]|eukprot:ETN98685.1 hypothetical protein RFI_38807 [Reticulomyxa filosa]